MSAKALNKLHIVPSGKTIDTDYYIKKILKRELKPALSQRHTVGRISQRRLVSNPRRAVLVQDGAK